MVSQNICSNTSNLPNYITFMLQLAVMVSYLLYMRFTKQPLVPPKADKGEETELLDITKKDVDTYYSDESQASKNVLAKESCVSKCVLAEEFEVSKCVLANYSITLSINSQNNITRIGLHCIQCHKMWYSRLNDSMRALFDKKQQSMLLICDLAWQNSGS